MHHVQQRIVSKNYKLNFGCLSACHAGLQLAARADITIRLIFSAHSSLISSIFKSALIALVLVVFLQSFFSNCLALCLISGEPEPDGSACGFRKPISIFSMSVFSFFLFLFCFVFKKSAQITQYDIY